jgi:DnaJ domain
MAQFAALRVALSLADRQISARRARSSPLPDGVTQLLRIANADVEALRSAQAITGRSQTALQTAVGIFVEQIMLHDDADSYRVLGVSSTAGRGELRRNMALLMKWLHPDGGESRAMRSEAVRSTLVHRVTQAWGSLKTEERRAAYDQLLREGRRAQSFSSRPARRARKELRRAKGANSHVQVHASSRRLVVYRFERGTMWSRIMNYLWVHV